MLDFTRFRALTFDCYGTLIDWETGLANALGALGFMQSADPERVLESFARAEAASESGAFKPYKEVLRETLLAIAPEFGVPLDNVDEYALSRSIRDWPAFPDTPAALRTLKRRYSLVVVSNIDRDLFELSRPKLAVELDALVMAEDVRSYKPAKKHFDRALELLALPRDRVLHVAQSLYHDITPARELGIPSVWVDRRAGKPGSGATFPAHATPDLIVTSMAMLATQVEHAFAKESEDRAKRSN